MQVSTSSRNEFLLPNREGLAEGSAAVLATRGAPLLIVGSVDAAVPTAGVCSSMNSAGGGSATDVDMAATIGVVAVFEIRAPAPPLNGGEPSASQVAMAAG